MSIYQTAVKKPVTTALIFVAVAVFGIFSLMNIPINLYPEFDANTIMVITTYSGASASDIENNVTKPLENTLNGVSNLKHITSNSKENSSVITLTFEYGIDIDVATNDVRDKLELVKSTLPDDANTPMIFKFGADDMPILLISATAEESMPGLNKILDDGVSNQIARIGGVGTVSITGLLRCSQTPGIQHIHRDNNCHNWPVEQKHPWRYGRYRLKHLFCKSAERVH